MASIGILRGQLLFKFFFTFFLNTFLNFSSIFFLLLFFFLLCGGTLFFQHSLIHSHNLFRVLLGSAGQFAFVLFWGIDSHFINSFGRFEWPLEGPVFCGLIR